MQKEKYYISTAIAYTSSKPHIGNTYEIVLADAIARNKRLEGYDVYFQTGTDEHGEKIELKAKEKGINPQEYVDQLAGQIKDIWDLMNTTYDRFVRTTDKNHEKVVQNIFKKMYEQDDIYKGEYKGLYCTPCESFWTESQLVDGKCPDCGREVEEKKEEAYFFRLSKYQDKLVDYIESHPEFDVEASSEEFHKLWPADLHLIGKDIIRFHTIYWPCFLMSLNIQLPKQVFGHPWLLSGGDKMSKSKGNILYADDLVSKYGLDVIRYFVLHEIPFADDGVITEELIVERNNSDLANILGNLVNRTIAMTNKYFDGIVEKTGVIGDPDQSLIEKVEKLGVNVKEKMDHLKIADAIDEVFHCLRASNKYIDETMPWALAKEEASQDRLKQVLYNLTESIRICAVYLQPFLPDTAEKIFEYINTDKIQYETTKIFGQYASGTKVNESAILFKRIEL